MHVYRVGYDAYWQCEDILICVSYCLCTKAAAIEQCLVGCGGVTVTDRSGYRPMVIASTGYLEECNQSQYELCLVNLWAALSQKPLLAF